MVVTGVHRSPLASTTPLDGYNNQWKFCCSSSRKGVRTHLNCMNCMRYLNGDTKSKKSFSRIHGRVWVALAGQGDIISNSSNLRMKRKGLLYKQMENPSSCSVPKVATLEFESVCEEKTMMVLEENDFVIENCTQQKLPPWSSLVAQSMEVCNYGESTSRVFEGEVDQIEDGLCYLEEMDEKVLSKRILHLSRSNKITSVLQLYRSMVFSGLRPDLHACNSLLSCLLRNKRLDDALKIFDSMKASEMITGHTYSLVLKAVSKSQGFDAALNMFEQAERDSNSKKYFDAVVYNTMISVCGKVKNWVQAKRMWRSLLDNGHVGTIVTYRLLVCIFVRCGQHELALDAYQEMIMNQLIPCDDVMQAIIGASANEGKWDLALNAFDSMLNSGMKPNLIAHNALINSLAKAGKVKLAFKIFRNLKSVGHVPDAYTWNALLCALYRAGRHAGVLQLCDRIKREHKSLLNLHIYNTALLSCQRLALWDRALQLLWEMEASEFSVTTASYNLVIGACEAARKPKVALQVYEHMVDRKQPPDTFTLSSLIRGCIWGSLWSKIDEILNQSAPDVSLYNAAVQGMYLVGNPNLGRKLYNKMRKLGLKPDGKTRALVLQDLSGA